MFSKRTVTIVVAFTIVATLYSLSELHSLSARHASDDILFVTQPAAIVEPAKTTQVSTKSQTSKALANAFIHDTCLGYYSPGLSSI